MLNKQLMRLMLLLKGSKQELMVFALSQEKIFPRSGYELYHGPLSGLNIKSEGWDFAKSLVVRVDL